MEQLDPADDAVVRVCHDVETAAHAADDPVWPADSLEYFRAMVTGGWSRDPYEIWIAYAPDAGDRPAVAGLCHVHLPELENLGQAFVYPVVAPAFRRRGIGRDLLRHAAARAVTHGRSTLNAATLTGSAGAGFAAACGAAEDLIEARRVLDLRKIPDGQFERLRGEAAEKAAGYRVVSWTGTTPEEYLGQAAGLHNAMNDAPFMEGWEDELWDADRVRERADGWLRFTPVRAYSVAALHEATGEMAALTQIRIDPAVPAFGHQGITAVTRPHRGHRLGMLVKAMMLEWMATAEPQLERIGTGNAASNQYMIAVNEALGFELAEPGWTFYQMPAASVR